MNLKTITSLIAAAMLIITASCSGGDNPENIASDAISYAEQKCRSSESSILGNLPYYEMQIKTAKFYVDSVFVEKRHALNDKFEDKELSESSLSKYKESYDKLEATQKQAIEEIYGIYQPKINEELDRLFAESSDVCIPVDASALNKSWYKDVKCYFCPDGSGYKLIFEITANQAGYHQGMTINSVMNFLNRPGFRLKAVDNNGNKVYLSSDYLNFQGSDNNIFYHSIKLPASNIAQFTNLACIKIMAE